MKKILLFVFLFLFIGDVKGEVYYSDYSNFSDYQEYYIEKSDTVDVENELRYKYYYNVKEIGPVDSIGLDNGYEYCDGFSSTGFSEWNKEKPSEKTGRIIEEKVIYEYQDIEDMRYIIIDNVNGSYGSLRITELEVYSNGSLIDYDFECFGCWENFEEYINNGIWNENESYIDNGGSLTIDLKKNYPVSSIELVLYIFDLGFETKTYSIDFLSEKNAIAGNSFSFEFSDYDWDNASKFNHSVYSNLKLYNPNYKAPYQSDELVIDVTKKLIQTYKVYSFQDKTCEYYNINRVYLDGYYNELENYLRDFDQRKTFYRYRIRDKFEIDENIIINDYNDTLNNHYNSTVPIIINGKIDYSKNGIYEIEFIAPFKTVTKNVSINIPSNYEKNIEDLNSIINELKARLEDSINQNNISLKEIDELTLEKNNYIKKIEYLNERNSIYIDKVKEMEETINRQNSNIKEVITNKDTTIDEYKNKILELQLLIEDEEKKNLEINKELSDLKEENQSLNTELSDNLLKINKLSGFSFKNKTLVFLIFLIISIIVKIYLKKSNQK